MAHEHRWRMIKSKDGSYHRVCMDCKTKDKEPVTVKVRRKKAPAKKASIRFVRQYTGSTGRIFRVYENPATGQRATIIMRDDRGYNTRMNYTQAEATAEARRRLS